MSNPSGSVTRVERLPGASRSLIVAATGARGHAYAGYSGFAVGAAIHTSAGRIFAGCNVENASSGLTICAERVAVLKAVSEGETVFDALAVVTDVGATPCGACLQVLAEFADDLPVLVANLTGDVWLLSLRELLPHGFPRESLRTLLRSSNGGEASTA